MVAVGIGLCVGIALGLLAAARRGWVEELVMRAADFVFAFPALLSAIMLTAIFGPGVGHVDRRHRRLQRPDLRPLARGSARAVLAREFVLAARAGRPGRVAITLEHVLPNIAPALIVQATIQFAIAILAEAALSYLGLGTQPPKPSWGTMLNDAQTPALPRAAGSRSIPGLAIVLSVLGLNLLGDGLRDLLDPRLARRRVGLTLLEVEGLTVRAPDRPRSRDGAARRRLFAGAGRDRRAWSASPARASR